MFACPVTSHSAVLSVKARGGDGAPRPARPMEIELRDDQRAWPANRARPGLSIAGSVHDPTDPVGRPLFNVLAMVAEFESDLIRLRTREGMRDAHAKGRLRGRQPKLHARQEAHLVAPHHAGEHSTVELAEPFGVGRCTIYRAIKRETQRRQQASRTPTR